MIFDSKFSLRTVCKSVDGCTDPSTGTPDPSTNLADWLCGGYFLKGACINFWWNPPLGARAITCGLGCEKKFIRDGSGA